MDVVIACSDLMTASRLAADGVEAVHCRTAGAVERALETHGQSTWFVDLQSFPNLPGTLRNDRRFGGRIVSFAPHVRVDLIEQARADSDRVVARGAAIRRFSELARGEA